MVEGLNLFRERFQSYTDSYVIIGGTACSEQHARFGLEFRNTKDIDIVLCLDSLSAGEFGNVFIQFIKEGQYSFQTTDERSNMARLLEPVSKEYPAKIELITRRPIDGLLYNGQRKIPVSLSADQSDFSAFIMEDPYYNYLQSHKEILDGLSIASVDCLMILKVKAWLSLGAQRQRGVHIDSDKIKKHKNDFFRLYRLLVLNNKPQVPDVIKQDIQTFLSQMTSDEVDLKSLKVDNRLDNILTDLYEYFGIVR